MVEINQVHYDLEAQASARLAATTDPMEVRGLVALYALADLERIGDHVEGIAKVALILVPSPSMPIPSVIVQIPSIAQLSSWQCESRVAQVVRD